MTKKDYIKLAAALAYTQPAGENAIGQQTWRSTAHAVADVLARDNDRFDRERFLKACGVLA